MQLHGPTDPVDTIPVEPYGTSGNVALRFPASVSLILTSAADADRLIIAATQAKDLLLVTKPEADEADPIELCGARERAGWMCIRADGHEGPHEADGPTMANPLITWEDDEPAFMAPFPHLPHLAEHQGGRPDCIICGIDHDAAARLAPPAPYSLGAMELLNDIFTDGAS